MECMTSHPEQLKFSSSKFVSLLLTFQFLNKCVIFIHFLYFCVQNTLIGCCCCCFSHWVKLVQTSCKSSTFLRPQNVCMCVNKQCTTYVFSCVNRPYSHPLQFIALINAHGILIVALKLSLTNCVHINYEFILSPIDQLNNVKNNEGHG